MDSFLSTVYSHQFLIGFAIGLILNRGVAWWRCYRENKFNPLPDGEKRHVEWNPRMLGILIAMAMLGWSLHQTSENRAFSERQAVEAKQFAAEVKDCQREFNQALRDRAQITSENDDLSQAQRRIVFHWIHDLIFPPEPYASMDPNDPRRQQFGLTLTINTEREFQASLNRQDELEKDRDKRALPEPTCGK